MSMTDPYETLGIPRTASDDEVKEAYRSLAKKYHPDNYNNAPDIADLAAEKMREINEAHDTIVKERRSGARSQTGTGAGAGAGAGRAAGNGSATGSARPGASANASGAGKATGGSPNAGRYSTTTEFANVRNLIMGGRYEDADEVLNAIPTDRRSGEWYFLKGTVLYRRGWLEQAFTYFKTAVDMSPNNNEFRAAYNQANKMRGGGSGGYKISGKEGVGCNLCSSCCGMACADQCCECCGGDIIPCC